MTSSVLMIDGIGTDVPAILARFGRAHPVQGYIWQPGVFPYIPWTKAQLAEFPAGHMLTATRGGYPQDAEHARELDRETGDAGDEDVAPWLISRHDFGHKDGQVYVDLSNVAGVLKAISDGGLWAEAWWRLRIAWWWGRPFAPTLGQVMNAVRSALTSAGVPNLEPGPERIRMAQWFAGGSYDLNAVYGPTDFTRP